MDGGKLSPEEYRAQRREINAETRRKRTRSFSGDSHTRPRGFDWPVEMAAAVTNNETAMQVAQRLKCSEAAVRAQAKRHHITLARYGKPAVAHVIA